MNKLHDYLDFRWIRITTVDKHIFEGHPVVIDYADESESGEDEITLESKEWDGPQFLGLRESEIASIEIIRE